MSRRILLSAILCGRWAVDEALGVGRVGGREGGVVRQDGVDAAVVHVGGRLAECMGKIIRGCA